MKMQAKCKSKEELMALDSFVEELTEFGGLCMNNTYEPKYINIGMFNKDEELFFKKEWKSFEGVHGNYHLEWLKDIVVYDDKLEVGLEINGLTLTVKILKQDDSIIRGNGVYKKFKDKFDIRSIANLRIGVTEKFLSIHGFSKDKESYTHTFKSQKALRKWVSRLLRCK